MAEMIEYHSGKSAKPHRKFLKYLEFFGIIFETETLTSIKGSQNSYSGLESKKTLSHNIGS